MTTKQAEKILLAAEKRTVLGKQVKKLRKQGILPANIFGKDFKSLSISVQANDFTKVFSEAGETGVVYITVDGEEIPTLVKEVQKHPVNDNILHIDLRKINLKQKIETEVPLEYVGESPAEKDGAVLMYPVDKVVIEALPTDIPHALEIDLSTLTEIDQTFTIANLPKSDKYVIIDDPETVLVSVTAHKEESIEPDTTTTIPEGEEGAEGEAAAEGAEGAEAAPAEGGEAAPEEKKEE
jgi:large subunit ribosomal protein L25